jgi:hypothetical protein
MPSRRTLPLAPAAFLVLASLPACHHGTPATTRGSAPDAASAETAASAPATLSGSVWVQQKGFMFTENPAARATVKIACDGVSGQATTDASGEFRIAGLRSGPASVTASTGSPAGSVDEQVTLDAGDNTIRIVLPAAQ